MLSVFLLLFLRLLCADHIFPLFRPFYLFRQCVLWTLWLCDDDIMQSLIFSHLQFSKVTSKGFLINFFLSSFNTFWVGSLKVNNNLFGEWNRLKNLSEERKIRSTYNFYARSKIELTLLCCSDSRYSTKLNCIKNPQCIRLQQQLWIDRLFSARCSQRWDYDTKLLKKNHRSGLFHKSNWKRTRKLKIISQPQK